MNSTVQERVDVIMGAEDASLAACKAHGFWAALLRLAGALNVAVSHGMDILMMAERHWNAVDLRDCSQGGFACLFKPLCNPLVNSSCSIVEGSQEQWDRIKRTADQKERRRSGRHRWSACPSQALRYPRSTISGYDTGVNDFFGPSLALAFPQDTPTSQQAFLVSHVFHPLPFIDTLATQLRETLGLNKSAECLGVHVRRGDKYASLGESDRRVFEQVYKPYIDHVLRKEGVRHVYVSTDSKDITTHLQTQQRQQKRTMEYVFLPSELPGRQRPQSRDNAPFHIVRDYWNVAEGSYNRTHATLGIIVDSRLLAGCDYFIGTHTSAMSKGVFLLRYARMQRAGVRKGRIIETTFWPDWPSANLGGWLAFVFGTSIDHPNEWGRIADKGQRDEL
ncbi:unnamed protein product [Vitrella brassicaformis CCMP3155]|uniref:GT23 domain-containing protein n=2 Tax=Vitrella brassicaformis TaxID=1169539 RepID=A0A0G4F0H0_VITBC|nr:unnamed protein product [Vitrella brassicaformis CCMP3155]|eukprot:CEM05228.1 unnamed protein product [Vitrella brassicaformis CCMP3155]